MVHEIDLQTPTVSRYFDPMGQKIFREDRHKLHQSIIRKVLDRVAGQEPGYDPPELIIIAGGPGCGKSTFTKAAEKKGIISSDIALLDLDDFAVLPEFREIKASTKHPHPEKHPVLLQEHNHILRRVVKAVLDQGKSIIVHTHGDDPTLEMDLRDIAHERGAHTTLIGLTRSPRRYIESQTKKGIGVDEHTPWSLSIYRDFSHNWPMIRQLHDDAFLYTYSSDGPPLQLVEHVHKGENGKSVVVYQDEEVARKFKFWQYINPHGKTPEEIFPQGQILELDTHQERLGRGRTSRRTTTDGNGQQNPASFAAKLEKELGSGVERK